MNSVVHQLGTILVYSAAGLCIFLMLLNRRLILMEDGKTKAAVILSAFVAIVGGSVVAGFFWYGLPWVLFPLAVLCLIVVGEVRRYLIRRSCAGTGPVGSTPHAVTLSNPVTTTDVMVHRYQVRRPDWNGAPLRIVHLTDLHVSPELPLDYFRHVLDLAEEAKPDLAFVTGDFICGIESLPTLREVLRPIARVETFAVLGNHDYWSGPGEVGSAVMAGGLRLLTNESATVVVDGRSVLVTGWDSPWLGEGRPFPATPNGTLHLVLSHNPDNIYGIAKSSADMVFSGHYHAGQIRLPFLGAIVVPSVYGRRLDHGHFVVNGTHLFVAAGIGAASPHFRIYCQPDIFVVDIAG